MKAADRRKAHKTERSGNQLLCDVTKGSGKFLRLIGQPSFALEIFLVCLFFAQKQTKHQCQQENKPVECYWEAENRGLSMPLSELLQYWINWTN